MKKLLSGLLVLSFVLVGCGGNSKSPIDVQITLEDNDFLFDYDKTNNWLEISNNNEIYVLFFNEDGKQSSIAHVPDIASVSKIVQCVSYCESLDIDEYDRKKYEKSLEHLGITEKELIKFSEYYINK